MRILPSKHFVEIIHFLKYWITISRKMQQLYSSSIVNREENHATCESFNEKLENVHNSMMPLLGGKCWR